MAHQLTEGDTLGTLTIIRLLGSGGMADVYEALDNRLGRHVAAKVLPQEYSRNQDFIMRFEREVKASAALSHPNIVTVFEFGSEGGLNYYTMRLLNGGDLRDKITRGMTIVEVLTTMRGVLQAFQHAHSRGFVHRDVKPENIMYDEQGTPTLTDFGIAKVLDSQTQMTQTGMAVGTPRYISPEQATGKPVDGRSDLYSLGCILYEMLTGSSPYKADTPIATIFQHVNEPIPVLGEEFSNFQPLLEKLMAKSPETRMQNAEEALAYIDETFPRDWTGVFSAQTTQGMPVVGGQTPAVTPIRTQTVPATSSDGEEKTQLISTAPRATTGNRSSGRAGPNDDFGATVVMPRGAPANRRTAAEDKTDSGKKPLVLTSIAAVLGLVALGAYFFTQTPDSALPVIQDGQTVAPATEPEQGDTATETLQRERDAAAARQAQDEAEAKAEANRKAKEEAERQAKLDAERKAKLEAERQASLEAERQASLEAERKAKLEADRKTEAEAQAQRKAQQESISPTQPPADTTVADEEAAAQQKAAAEREAREAAKRKRAEEERRKRAAQEAEAERLQRLEAERIQAEQNRQAREAEEKAAEEERMKKLKKPVPIGF